MISENMRDQDELDRDDAPETEEAGASGIEYIGNQPINGPVIGSEQPPVDSAAAQEKAHEDEIPEASEADTEPRPTGEGDELNWYVVHCYSGYENKVKHNLEQRIEA